METTMKLAIETYSELTKNSIDYIQEQILQGDKVLTESVIMLMFAVSK